MTEPVIVVEVGESPLDVGVDTGTLEVTVTDLENTDKVTVIDAEPIEVVIAEEQVAVNVNLGSGNTQDASLIMELLGGKLDLGQLSVEMQADITLMRDLWTRLGRDLDQLLTQVDEERIVRLGQEYTDTMAQTTAIDIERVDDRVTANESRITQTAQEINLRVSTLDTQVEESLTAQSARIDLTNNLISSQVTKLNELENGALKQAQSDINQTAYGLATEVSAREALANGPVAENTAKVTQTAEALVTTITSTNELTNRVESAESRMTATEAVTTILMEGLVDSTYSLKAMEELTAKSYGVVIEEDVGGTKYVAGFEMLVHPMWLASTGTVTYRYEVDDLVSYTDDKVYQCILAHDGAADNSPGSVNAATYWVLAADSSKADFNVRAENFRVITPDGVKPVFVVDGASGKVTVNGELVVAAVKSLDYDEQDPSKSWFNLDPITGQATFNNMIMTFGNAALKQEVKDALGITDKQLLFWEGSRSVVINGFFDTAEQWSFDAPADGGAMIEIEYDDAFAGELHIAMNDKILTVSHFGDQDFGDVSISSGSGFSDENTADDFRDLTVGDKVYDLGGFS